MPTGHTQNDLLRIGAAAARLGVSVETLRRWSNAGAVTYTAGPSGHRRYRPSDLDALLVESTAGRAS